MWAQQTRNIDSEDESDGNAWYVSVVAAADTWNNNVDAVQL